MSTIPKEIEDKIEEFTESGKVQLNHHGAFKQGTIYGYQLATDGREQSKTDFDRTTFPAQGQKPFGYDEKKEAEELAYILRERPTNDGREELEKELAYIKDTLDDCREYMDDRADVDVDNDYFVPNKEAKLLSRIDSTIEKLNKHYGRSN